MMTTGKPTPNHDLALYLRLFRWARPYWAHLVGLFLLSLLATPLALLVPLPLKIALDSGLGSKPLPHLIRPFIPAGFNLTSSSALLFAVGLLIAVTIFTQIQTLTLTLLKTYTGEKLLWHLDPTFSGRCSDCRFLTTTLREPLNLCTTFNTMLLRFKPSWPNASFRSSVPLSRCSECCMSP